MLAPTVAALALVLVGPPSSGGAQEDSTWIRLAIPALSRPSPPEVREPVLAPGTRIDLGERREFDTERRGARQDRDDGSVRAHARSLRVFGVRVLIRGAFEAPEEIPIIVNSPGGSRATTGLTSRRTGPDTLLYWLIDDAIWISGRLGGNATQVVTVNMESLATHFRSVTGLDTIRTGTLGGLTHQGVDDTKKG